MLHEDYVHFIYGAKIYAVHTITGQPHVVHLRMANGEQKAFYFESEHGQLPEQVKQWWTEYKERILSEGQGTTGCLEHSHTQRKGEP